MVITSPQRQLKVLSGWRLHLNCIVAFTWQGLMLTTSLRKFVFLVIFLIGKNRQRSGASGIPLVISCQILIRGVRDVFESSHESIK